MHRFFVLFNKYKTLLYFLSLQSLCFWLIIVNNKYHNVYAFNTSNRTIGKILAFNNQVNEYLSLREVKETLAAENAELKKIILSGKIPVDSTLKKGTDSSYLNRYSVVVAKVINNSTTESKNFLTINKGTMDSVEVDMGVIGSNGIVGKIKSCSRHFATVYSVLHTNNSVSAKLKKTNTEGSVIWDGSDATIVVLKNIPRHVKVAVNDTVVTSSYSDVFPEGVMIGKIIEIKQKGEEAFFRIKVKLNTDFRSLGYVYVVNNKLRPEKDSLESLLKKEKE
jgi:rod shape-determining protein MreC